MNLPNQPGLMSATYWEFSNTDPDGYEAVDGTYIGEHPILTIPGLPGASPADGGGYDPRCNRNVLTPAQYLESGYGTGIRGLRFLATFQGAQMPESDFSGADAFLFESVFFGERQCYDGGREYGFFYEPISSGIWVYWGTNENLESQAQVSARLAQVHANSQYYFEMFPTGSTHFCGFQVNVTDPEGTTVYSGWFPVNLNGLPLSSRHISGLDPGFCSSVLSGDSGFVTATAIYGPKVSHIPAAFKLELQRVFVGR